MLHINTPVNNRNRGVQTDQEYDLNLKMMRSGGHKNDNVIFTFR